MTGNIQDDLNELCLLGKASLDNMFDHLCELVACDSLEEYLDGHKDMFGSAGVPLLLEQMMQQRGLSKAELARRAVTSEVYLHQVLSGRRNPSRDRLLCFCLAMESGLGQVQQLLMAGGHSALLTSSKRDIVLFYCLIRHKTILETNEYLDSLDLPLLIR